MLAQVKKLSVQTKLPKNKYILTLPLRSVSELT